MVKRFLGRLYLEWLRIRWRYLRTVSAGEYVEAVARHYRLERDTTGVHRVSQRSADNGGDDSTE